MSISKFPLIQFSHCTAGNSSTNQCYCELLFLERHYMYFVVAYALVKTQNALGLWNFAVIYDSNVLVVLC